MKEPARYVECPACGASGRRLNGLWLRYARERAGLSLRDVAQRIKVISFGRLSDYELGSREIPWSLEEKLVKAVAKPASRRR